MSLKGRGAVVTGGGRGIGEAVARALAEAGCRVVVTARSTDQIEAVAGSLVEAGHEAWAVSCDVSDESAVAQMARRAEEHLGRVDILVNNAGVAPTAPLARLTLDMWNQALGVNATGTVLCTRAFVPAMMERGWGRVVNVSSVAGLFGAKYMGAYAASKHAVIGFTRSVAPEAAEAGVTVNAVCPGFVDTAMTDEGIRMIGERSGKSREEAVDAILADTPQTRLIRPEEVAKAVLTLCEDAAADTNGVAVVLDGTPDPN